MTTENTPATENNEAIVFDFDLSDANIDRPVLKDGTYSAKIASTTRKKNEETGVEALNVRYTLTQSAPTVDDKTVNEGFNVFQRIQLTPSGKLTLDAIKTRIGRLNFAATGNKVVSSTADLWNKEVRIKVSLREAHKDEKTGKEYGASNEVSDVFPIGTQKGGVA